MSNHPPPQIPGYALERELGVGGMATVYLATQVSLERRVAIKILRVSAQDAADPERHEKRFLREGKMLARLSHKNVCGIFDIAKVGNIAYIAMEYIEGGTLGDRLRRGMTAAEAISVVVQLAGALAAAHAIGIVHRDLKPANVMMRGKVPVLTDFGIARDLSSDRTEITGDNILGTPNYMSPEQISGQPIDGRSDIYSLGAMLFELLTGRQPYFGDSPIAVCMQHLQAPIPELPEAFAELQPIIDGMMAKSRDDRFPDMPSVVLALRAALLDSETLRTALRFDTELPWSEQLRELGFSFESTTGEQLRGAIKPRKPSITSDLTKDRPPRKPVAVALPPPEKSPPPARFGRRERWIAALAALLMLAFGVWWMTSEEQLTQEEMTIIRRFAKDFDDHVAEGKLVPPSVDNALSDLQAMYAQSRTHPDVLAREQVFREAVAKQAETLVDNAQFGLARGLLNDAAPVLDEAVLEQQLARLDQAQQAVDRDKNIAAQVAALEQILSASNGINDPRLGPALRALLEQTKVSDPRYQTQVSRVADALTLVLRQAITDRDPAAAVAVVDRMRELLPDASETRAASAEVDNLVNRLASERTQTEIAALLQSATLTPAAVDQVLAGLSTLQTSGAGDAVLTLRDTLIERTLASAEAALAAADLAGARALVAPVLQRYSDVPRLRAFETRLVAAETQVAEQRRAEEEARRQGRLALDAVPWGKVMAVTGADGKAQALAADPTTPLLLTLPEGDYTVTMQGPDGKTLKTSASVKRGQVSVAELSFAALDADSYLKQAGYR